MPACGFVWFLRSWSLFCLATRTRSRRRAATAISPNPSINYRTFLETIAAAQLAGATDQPGYYRLVSNSSSRILRCCQCRDRRPPALLTRRIWITDLSEHADTVVSFV